MKYLISFFIFLISCHMNGQHSLRNIEQLIIFDNPYGEQLVDHIEEVSNSVYKITGIEKTGPYLEIQAILQKFESSGEEAKEVIYKMSFPLAIHVCETYRKRIGGTWKTVQLDNRHWMIYVQKGDTLYHPQNIYESYLQNFQTPVVGNVHKEASYNKAPFDIKKVLQSLQEKLNFSEGELDFSVKSLEQMDKKIVEHHDLFFTPKIYLHTQFYLGEVFRKEHGGEWLKKSVDANNSYSIQTPDGHIYPITKLVYETLHEDDHGLQLSGFYQYYLINLNEKRRK